MITRSKTRVNFLLRFLANFSPEYIDCKYFFFLIVVKTSMEVFSKFFFRNHNFKGVNLAKVVIGEKFAYFCVFLVNTKD